MTQKTTETQIKYWQSRLASAIEDKETAEKKLRELGVGPEPEDDTETQYEINFGGHILALIGINDGKPYVAACMNGYGDSLGFDQITVKEINIAKEIE